MEQKRVYKRIEDLIEVEVTAKAFWDESVVLTRTRDIGAGGLKLFLNKQFSVGEEVMLKVTLPGEKKTVQTKAAVVDSYLIGVVGDRGQEMLYETRLKFVGLGPDAKNVITHYVYECRKAALDARSRK